MQPLVNLFHIGPQKSATTWFFRAIEHHPEVATPPKDSIHFFDMLYWRGEDWLHGLFPKGDFRCYLDPTPSYSRDKQAARRIYDYNPDAKIMMTVRNPIDRAFSHYWHEKKKDKINFEFAEVFANYDLFDSWVLPGLYAQNYKAYREYFPADQMHVMVFDDISADPVKVMEEACDFAGLPNVLDSKIVRRKRNVASGYRSLRRRAWENHLLQSKTGKKAVLWGLKNYPGRIERTDEIDAKTKSDLRQVFEPDIRELERIIDRDLSNWLA